MCLAQQRRERRRALYEQVWDLREKGELQTSIAQQLGISERTVRRYLHRATFPERQERRDRDRGLLDPYRDYLLQLWNSGCHSSKLLFEQLQAHQGYQGGYRTLQRYLQRMRSSLGLPPRRGHQKPISARFTDSNKPPLTARRVVSLVMRRRENRESEDEEVLAKLKARQAQLSSAISLARDFAEIIRNLASEQLDAWIQKAIHSQSSPLAHFALGLTEDYQAIQAGVTLP